MQHTPITAHRGTFVPMLRLALPVLAEQVLTLSVWISDRVLTGRFLETDHLAAITVVTYLLWLVVSTVAFVSIGATAMVARFVGAGRASAAALVTNQALSLAAILSAALMAAGLLLGGRAVLAMQLEGDSARLAARYLFYILPALPLIMVQEVGVACLRGAGDMVAGLWVKVLVNAINIAVSWALVVGLGPLPCLGWDGIAIGTMVGFAVGGLTVLGMLAVGRRGLKVHVRWLRPRGDLVRRILRISVPGGADLMSIIGCQLWFVSIINQLGSLATAAHGVAIGIESTAFLPGAAFQVAAATLAGQYLGAKDHRRAGRSVLMALAVGGGLMAVMGAIFFTHAYGLARLFVDADQDVVARQAVPLLRTVALGIPALAPLMILTGALRGAGDTRWPLAFSLIGFLAVRIPLAHWLAFDALTVPGIESSVAGWGLGVVGCWYAMVADLYVRAGLVAYRFLHGGWKRVVV